MRYQLSDKQLLELVCHASIPKIVQTFPDFVPSERTIYRRLEKYGIRSPSQMRDELLHEIVLHAPPEISDERADSLARQEIRYKFEELRTAIFQEAKEFEERFNQ